MTSKIITQIAEKDKEATISCTPCTHVTRNVMLRSTTLANMVTVAGKNTICSGGGVPFSGGSCSLTTARRVLLGELAELVRTGFLLQCRQPSIRHLCLRRRWTK